VLRPPLEDRRDRLRELRGADDGRVRDDDDIDEVLDARARSPAGIGARVGVKLLREVLLYRQRRDLDGANAGELEQARCRDLVGCLDWRGGERDVE
jgi:hypothetical protein